MNAANLGLALLLIAAPGAAGADSAEPGGDRARAHASGRVFHDRNRNGTKDRFEWGIRNVAVSNGRDVVLTDWRGRYRISVDDDEIIFVVKPGGWATPVDADQLPRFYYIHKPAGSPEHLAFPGVAPTGPLPEHIDFPLYRQRESSAFRVILLGDPQPRSIAEVDLFARDIVAELIGTDAAFGLTLGDLVGDDLSLFEPVNRAVSRIGIPWYNAIGNHDQNLRAADDRHSDETFERVYGPTSYAFVVGRVHFIVLDDVVYAGAESAERGARSYAGGLSERQLEFVEHYLATVPSDRLVVLAMHIPFDSPPFEVPQRRALFEILGDRPHTVSLVAHTHFRENRFFGPEDGFHGPRPHHQLIAGAASGSWWLGAADEQGIPHATMRCGAPNGYSLLSFDGNRYSIRFKAARRPADHQMSISAPAVVAAAAAAATEVVVNVFAGSERMTVEMRLDERDAWTPMSREAREDPDYLAATLRDQQRTPRPEFFLPPAIESPHLWVGNLPAKPPPGTHALEVRATDMFGQVFRAHHLIIVE